jgi:hypothetical protein
VSERNYRGTLYLDWDGVIIHKPRLGRGQYLKAGEDPHLPIHPDGLEWAALPTIDIYQREFYYPKIIKSLAELGLKVISGSGRQTGIFIGYKEILEPLDIQGSLNLHPLIEYWSVDTIPVKASKVLGHWTKDPATTSFSMQHKDPSPVGDRAIWMDDHIDNLSHYGHAEYTALQEHPELLQVVPNPDFGVTLAQLDEMDRFLSNPLQ